MFEFTEEDFGPVKVLHMRGKMMGGPNTHAMRSCLAELAKTDGTPLLVMDFDQVKWINSTGVGIIIACLTALRRQGGDIHFANLHDMPQRYFELTKLNTVVKTFDTLTEAIETFTTASVI